MKWDNIPSDLKLNGLWCAWKLVDGKKLPFTASTGELARSNDKGTFEPFKIALKHVDEYLHVDESGRFLGGLGLGIFNGFSAIDIDKCVTDGKPNQLATDIIDYMQSYTEFSPSGTGIRIIFKTDTRINKETHYIHNRKLGLEIYISDNTNKYVTITGNVLLASSIAECDISYIIDKYMKKQTETVITHNQGTVSNERLIQALSTDSKLNELWNSTASGSGGNESETDLALCNKIAFYVDGNYEAINDNFMSSPYFSSKDKLHYEKWVSRSDYREDTIKKSIRAYQDNKLSRVVADYELTDTGNAQKLYEIYGSKIRYNVDNRVWYYYNSTYWQPDTMSRIKLLAEAVIEQIKNDALTIQDSKTRESILKNVKRMLSSGGKEAMIKEAEHINGIPVTNEDFDKNGYLINTKSGIVDLKTGDITLHDKTLMLSKYIPFEVDYTPPKRWLQFLADIQPNKPHIVDYIQKSLGYGLCNSAREQCMFIFLGDGANGKSLLLDVVHEITNGYSVSADVKILMENKNNTANLGDIARLKGARTVIVEEPEQGDKLAESRVKTLTSGLGSIVARFLYGNEFEFNFTAKIFMSANHKPIIRGTDNGIWRRIRVIPFTRVFKDHEQDLDLQSKLMKEAPQILGWLIQGFKKYQSEGLESPSEILDENKNYRSEMDIVQRWINDNCEVDTQYTAKADELYSNFMTYVTVNNEFKISSTIFGRNLGKKFEKRRTGSGNIYVGLKLRKESLGEGISKSKMAGYSREDI